MPKVDIKHFKKISSDQHKTVLQHPDGHHLVIAHEHLSPKMRAEVAAIKEAPSQKMFDGGSVNVNLNPDFSKLQNPNPVAQEIAQAEAAQNPSQAESLKNLMNMTGADVPEIQSQKPMLSPTENAPQAGDTLASPQQTQNKDPWGTQGLLDQTMKGFNEQEQGIKLQAQGQAQQGQEEAQALKQGLDQQQALQQHYEQATQQIESERQGFMNDLKNSHIDPDQYLTNMSGGQRVGTAIGLILGGIGGGLTGQENPAMKFLQSQIDRNIEGQKSNVGIKNKLLEANRQHFQDEKSATDMTRVMMNDMLAHKIQLAAANSTDPLVKGRAQQALGQLDATNAPLLAQIKMRKAILGGTSQGSIDPSMGVRFLVPEHQQPAAYKEVDEAQKMIKVKDNLLGSFDKLAKINTTGDFLKSPIQTQKQVSAIRDPLVAGLSKDTAGRFTEADAGMVGALFPAKGDTKKTIDLKRTQLNKLISEKMNFPVLDSYGLNPIKSGTFNSGGQNNFKFKPRGQ